MDNARLDGLAKHDLDVLTLRQLELQVQQRAQRIVEVEAHDEQGKGGCEPDRARGRGKRPSRDATRDHAQRGRQRRK